jgi:small subunit ribosomal protein S17e
MKRIAKGPVRGISFALQEEERERKDNYVPEVSAVDTDLIEIDADTKAMLKNFNMHNISGLQIKDPNNDFRRRRPRN